MTRPSDRLVLIYAKPARMGLAKTRLAKGLDDFPAANRIARFTAARTLRAAMDPRWQTRLYTAPDTYVRHHPGLPWPANLARHSQGTGGLGDRLQKGLEEAGRRQVIFIGADAPDITADMIWRGFLALHTHDAAVGPARDGGFWLLGLSPRLRRQSPFYPVRWSGPHTLDDTRRNLGPDAKIATLVELTDIDEAFDWAFWLDNKKI